MPLYFSLQETISAFVVLFAIIDILGAIPIIISIKEKKREVVAWKAVAIAFVFFVVFLFLGEMVLNLFGVDIESFAIAGAFILFALAVEMIFDVELFKQTPSSGGATIVPIVFPLVAGPGALTTLLSLRAEYSLVNIILCIVLNLAFVFFVLRYTDYFAKWIGEAGISVLRKIFGVILVAMGVKLMTSNFAKMIENLSSNL